MITLQQLVQENIVIRPVTCNGTEVLLRDCLRGRYDTSINTVSAMVAGLSCSTLILIRHCYYGCTFSVNEVIATHGTLPVMSTSVTLGALIGLFAAALVVVVTGWIVSCVYFQRKINK